MKCQHYFIMGLDGNTGTVRLGPGALLPIVIAKKREAWEWLALALMLTAILLNLYRIVNSLGDLYTTTMGQLSPGKIHDASYEFIHYYFSINVVVIAVALFVVSRRSRAAEGGQVGADHPRPRRG